MGAKEASLKKSTNGSLVNSTGTPVVAHHALAGCMKTARHAKIHGVCSFINVNYVSDTRPDASACQMSDLTVNFVHKSGCQQGRATYVE